MTGLSEIPSVLSGPALVAALAALGLAVGVLTGLFGAGGAFLLNPLLNVLLGIPYTLAAGSSLSFIIGTSAAGWSRHLRLGNVAGKTMTILAGGSVCGALLGARLHLHLEAALSAWGPEAFTLTMHALFVLMLLPVAGLVLTWSPHAASRSLLQRLPLGPYITIRRVGLHGVSLPGLCMVGLGIGVFSGLMGIGGGVLLMPVMMLAVGLDVRQAVGTSLGVILFGSIAGALMYGHSGQVNLWIVMSLLVGSTFGVQIGAYLNRRLQAGRIRRGFAVLALLCVALLIFDFLRKVLH